MKATDESMFARIQYERPAPSSDAPSSRGLWNEHQGPTHRIRHGSGIATDARKCALCLLESHAGQGAQGTHYIEQLAHVGDVSTDF